MFVFFPDESKIGIKLIRTYCTRMQEENIHRAIMVVQGSMSPSVKQVLVEMAPKYIIEQFLESELLINITEHEPCMKARSGREDHSAIRDRRSLHLVPARVLSISRL